MEIINEIAIKLEKTIQEEAFKAISLEGDYLKGDKLLQGAQMVRNIVEYLKGLENNHDSATKKEVVKNNPSKNNLQRISNSKSNGYPVFLVEHDSLVKVGKGKSKKSKVYRHTIPKANVDKIINHLNRFIEKEFTLTDAIQSSENDCPDYQFYVTAELIKALGYLLQPRRGSYYLNRKLPDTEKLFTVIETNNREA